MKNSLGLSKQLFTNADVSEDAVLDGGGCVSDGKLDDELTVDG